MALPQLPAHAQHQLGQGVNKENPLTRVYAKRAANCLAALFVYALSPMEINIPLLAHGLLRTRGIFPLLGEEPYRAIISASLRQCPLVPRVGIPTAAYAWG